jgi:N-acyl-L-homoserine lactone synthetase
MNDMAHEHKSSAVQQRHITHKERALEATSTTPLSRRPNMSGLRSEYERRLTQARNDFGERKSVSMILDTRLEADLLHIFLVYFSALGVGMTEPVESWIKRAGERCHEIGLSETGSALIRHAGQEAGHHRLMIDDVHILARHWNQKRGVRSLDSQALFSRSLPPAVTQYRNLHHRVIEGPAPFAQVAIEYEIEALSVRYGPALLCQCKRLLPEEASTGLSFLAEHVAIDTGHTQFNERQLDRLLDARPQSLEDLIDAGVAALNAYGDFLDACLSAANNFLSPNQEPAHQDIVWSLKPPPGTEPALWRDELSSFRGRTLWNNGRRPHFLRHDGTPRDFDSIDDLAWHILARAGGQLVGCARVLALSSNTQVLADDFFGRGTLERALSTTGLAVNSVAEVSRWVVTPSRNGRSVKTPGGLQPLGFALLASAFAVARRLGCDAIIGSCGIRDGQDRLIAHAGGRPVPGVPVRKDDRFDDVLVLLMLHTPTPGFERLIRDMESTLADQGAWNCGS